MSLVDSIDDNSAMYRLDVFDLILFFASEKGEKSLPRKEEGFVVSLASGLVEYLNGDTRSCQPPQNLVVGGTSFIHEFNETVERAFEQKSKSINMNPALVEILRNFVLVEWKHDWGESWWRSGLWEYLLYFPWSFHDNNFNLDVPTVKKIESEKIPRTDSDTLKHCREIGCLMRKYIDLRNQNSRA